MSNLYLTFIIAAMACACHTSDPTPNTSNNNQPPPPAAEQNNDEDQGQSPIESVLSNQLPVTIHPITPTCSDVGRFSFHQIDQRFFYDSPCFPSASYFFDNVMEGQFLTTSEQPLPTLGRSCGHFHILVVFFNTVQNRQLWSQNTAISSSLRNQLRDRPQEGLPNLFRNYTPQNISEALGGTSIPITFQFEFRVIDGFQDSYSLTAPELVDEFIQQFLVYDAILFLEDLGTVSGEGIGKWPMRHPLYNPQMPYAFRLNPRSLTPGLFANELFRRNVPVTLSQYTYGPQNLVTDHGVTYDRTPIYNPRTGENILEQMSATPLHLSFLAWSDIDQDSIVDCQDDIISATTDNVDADLIPDVFDPDLTRDNGPYFWRFSRESE